MNRLRPDHLQLVKPAADFAAEPEEAACPACGGRGWLVAEDGRFASYCHCKTERERAERIDRASRSVPRAYAHCSRATWRGPWPDGAPASGERWDLEHWLLLFCGPTPGVGKTHAATALYVELAASGALGEAFWISARELVATVSREIADHAGRQIEKRAAHVPLLLLDDLGAESDRPFAREVVSGVLFARYDWKRATIVTTNAASLVTFDALDPRLASRLAHGSIVVPMAGEDRRLDWVTS